jgi:hypothetical protein
MNHTPTPWKWDGKVWDYDSGVEAPWLVADSPEGTAVIRGEIECSQSDAEFIVRAVNAHDKLVEAAQYATCEKCDHNRCQGLRDALKGLV